MRTGRGRAGFPGRAGGQELPPGRVRVRGRAGAAGGAGGSLRLRRRRTVLVSTGRRWGRATTRQWRRKWKREAWNVTARSHTGLPPAA